MATPFAFILLSCLPRFPEILIFGFFSLKTWFLFNAQCKSIQARSSTPILKKKIFCSLLASLGPRAKSTVRSRRSIGWCIPLLYSLSQGLYLRLHVDFLTKVGESYYLLFWSFCDNALRNLPFLNLWIMHYRLIILMRPVCSASRHRK